MSPDGKPVQVSASSLQAAGLQNQNGIYHYKKETDNCPKIVNKSKVHLIWVFRLHKRINTRSNAKIYVRLCSNQVSMLLQKGVTKYNFYPE